MADCGLLQEPKVISRPALTQVVAEPGILPDPRGQEAKRTAIDLTENANPSRANPRQFAI